MSRSICERQNEERQLDRLAAQRQLYSDGKRSLTIEVVLVSLTPVLSAVLVHFFPHAAAWTALAGVVVLLLNELGLEDWQNEAKLRAARIQEAFDYDVLTLPAREAFTGPVPTPELVAGKARQHARKFPDHKGLRDWYTPAVCALPEGQGRVLCQRENCVWDSAQGRRYATCVGVFTSALSLVAVATGLALRLGLDAFLTSVIVPLAPGLVWGVREWRRHLQAAANGEWLADRVERIWKQHIEGHIGPEALQQASRDIQDALFDHRRHRPLVFDWLYQRLKSEQEADARAGTGELVEMAKQTGSAAEWVVPGEQQDVSVSQE